MFPFFCKVLLFLFLKLYKILALLSRLFMKGSKEVLTLDFSRNKGQMSFDFQSNILHLPFISLLLINFIQSTTIEGNTNDILVLRLLIKIRVL